MKRIIALVLCLITVVALSIAPTNATLKYSLNKSDDTVSVQDSGLNFTLNDSTMTATVGSDVYSKTASAGSVTGELVIPEFVTAGGKTYAVTAIGKDAFSGTGITTIVIGNNVTEIGEFAFAGCDDLQIVVLGSKVEKISGFAFWGCTKLSSVTLGAVKTVGTGAFMSCVSLVEVTVPTTCATIGEKAFNGCSSLVAANMFDHCPAIGADAFAGCANGFVIGCSAGAAANFADTGLATKEVSAHVVIPATYVSGNESARIIVNIEANNADLTGSAISGITDIEKNLNPYVGALFNGCVAAVPTTAAGNVTAKVGNLTGNGTVAACDHGTTKDIVTECATCDHGGHTKTVCATCHKTISVNDTKQLEHVYRDIVTEPNCIDGGYTTHKCELCRERVVDSEVPANGHAWDEGIVNQKSTISNHGKKTFACEVCKRQEVKELPFLCDLNNDGKINAADAIIYLRQLAGWEIDFVADVADANGDTKYNTTDVIYILRYVAGWDVKFGK